jgi:uncharacterized protein (TIGR02266 family)
MGSTPDMSERRKYPRVAVEMVARLRRLNTRLNPEAVPTTTGNVSLGGVFIETTAPFKEGDHVAFDINLPKRGQSVSALGVVRWQRSDEPRGIGVEFIQVTSEDKKKIETVLLGKSKS